MDFQYGNLQSFGSPSARDVRPDLLNDREQKRRCQSEQIKPFNASSAPMSCLCGLK
jgi:hypothetical protein